jgi:hypothetical protein
MNQAKIKQQTIFTYRKIIVFSAMLLCLLYVGFYFDREFNDLHIFLKHKPSFKIIFTAPRGEADISTIEGNDGFLTEDENIEEQYYIDFVEEHGGSRRSIFLGF